MNNVELRDLFAAHALGGLASRLAELHKATQGIAEDQDYMCEQTPELIAKTAFTLAD